jgi:hypothetical protein
VRKFFGGELPNLPSIKAVLNSVVIGLYTEEVGQQAAMHHGY